MLTAQLLFGHEDIEVADVVCSHPAGEGKEIEQADRHALVFVRRGCFVRCVEGTPTLLDPTLAYCMNPGEEQRFDHPHAHGDDCTWISLSPELFASLWGGDPTLPRTPIPSPPAIDLEQRLILAGVRAEMDGDEIFERTIVLSASALEQVHPARVASGRVGTIEARRALVEGAREALAADPGHSLTDLARMLSVSPHHLSRIFRAQTGHTIARHRMRLRVRDALERLAGGDRDLARVAAEAGFYDQSHLTRVLLAETHWTPSAMREVLMPAVAPG